MQFKLVFSFMKLIMNNILKEYVDALSLIGKKLDSKYWWATSLSSKNRFQTPFLDYFLKIQKNEEANIDDYTSSSNLLQLLKHFLFELIKCFLVNIRCSKAKKEFLKKYINSEVSIIKTFSYKKSLELNNDKFNDPYFGDLADYLDKEGERCFQLVKPLGCIREQIELSKNNLNVIPFYYFLTPSDLVRNLFETLTTVVNKKGIDIKINEKDISQDLNVLLEKEKYNSSFFHALLMYRVFENITKKLKIKKVIYPYENNAWERLSIMSIKKFSSSTKIIGYVHTVVPEISANMFPGIDETQFAPFPDKILTIGKITKELLEQFGDYKNIQVESSCALRFKYLETKSILPTQNERIVLVALEGVIPAAKVLDDIFELSKICSEWAFYIRTHPALPYSKLQKFMSLRIKDFKNIKISEIASLDKDIERAKVVMYWGSTVGIEALALGKPVIHYDLKKELSYDPLFMYENYKWLVGRDDSLLRVLEEIYKLASSEVENYQIQTKEFLKEYFYPINDTSLKKFLL
jgi:hypothetical protein